MQVILLERVEKLGALGQVVEVKPGYARNYLLPRKKALRASAANIKYFEEQKHHIEAKSHQDRDAAEASSKALQGLNLLIIRQASEAGHLYGSVSARDIAEKIADTGLKVHRSQIDILSPIKELGDHQVKIRLHPELSVAINLRVAQAGDAAAAEIAS